MEQNPPVLFAGGCKFVQLIWKINFTLFNKDEDASLLRVVTPLLGTYPKETCLHDRGYVCTLQDWGGPGTCIGNVGALL